MHSNFFKKIPLPRYHLWNKVKAKKGLISFELELTARCNLKCRHCFLNVPMDDLNAKRKELTLAELKEISKQIISNGALWCLITGGEPLLRKDFAEIYIFLKKAGFLVSVFTNATLINLEHIKLFKMYPPRDIEVTVYGVTKKTYERVTQRKGSFRAFMRGLNLLLDNGIKVRLKSTVTRSNFKEFQKIRRFCQKYTKDYFRFDPFLHLRLDGNIKRNEEIISERLNAEEIVSLERADSARVRALIKQCDKLIQVKKDFLQDNHLFYCGIGKSSFYITYDGFFKFCSSLHHPDFMFDLKKGSLEEAWDNLLPKINMAVSTKREFLYNCKRCTIVNLCLWCPAHAYLEKGTLDGPIDYFCKVANARRENLESLRR